MTNEYELKAGDVSISPSKSLRKDSVIPSGLWQIPMTPRKRKSLIVYSVVTVMWE
jgi:hypothetical protein